MSEYPLLLDLAMRWNLKAETCAIQAGLPFTICGEFRMGRELAEAKLRVAQIFLDAHDDLLRDSSKDTSCEPDEPIPF